MLHLASSLLLPIFISAVALHFKRLMWLMKYEAVRYGLLFVEATSSQMVSLENLAKKVKQVHISVLSGLS